MKDGVKTTVEAKGTAHFILPKQIKALENGGVLAVVDGDSSSIEFQRYWKLQTSTFQI
jgi:hypothetical protein